MTSPVSIVPEVGNVGIAPQVDRAAYLADLVQMRSPLPAELDWLNPIRDRATARLQELAIPSTRDENWRFTDLAGLLKHHFTGLNAEPAQPGFANLEPFLLPEASHSRLVFVDGRYDPALSAIDNLPDGVLVTNFETATAIGEFEAALGHLATGAGAEEVFTTLNTASLSDGAVVVVPRNQLVEMPIHLLFVATQAGAMQTARVLLVAEAGSRCTLVEDYICLTEDSYLVNSVAELVVQSNAEVNHVRIQRDGLAAFHLGKTTVSQARDSRYTCTAVSLGGHLSRHNLEVYQQGEQTETTLNGLTMIAGEQVADTHSTIAFTQPHSRSTQLHKCSVDGRAHGIFNGKILVPQAAQLTDARQLSKNLLLSPKARVDTKPQLEITADNVKCAHGATVSQLENDEVFYLQSRGIDADAARKLLVYAFAYEVLSQIPVTSLRDRLCAIARPQP
jgi:Fe-S cluster assembly protein SufD